LTKVLENLQFSFLQTNEGAGSWGHFKFGVHEGEENIGD